MKRIFYTAKDCGCYIDGAVPRDDVEIIEKLNDMLPDYMSKDRYSGNIADEELNLVIQDLTEALQEVTEEDLVWIWEAGDLLLINQLDME